MSEFTSKSGNEAEISERDRAEQALRESEERFRIVQELSPDGFTILRPVRDSQARVIDFTWVYENAAIARMNGTDPQKVLGKRLLELFPGHRGTRFLKAYQQVAETGKQIVFEGEYAAEQLPISWYRVVVVPLGQDIAILAQDITERKRTERVLRRQAELLRLAFDAIILWRLDGGVENWNLGAERLYGISEREAVGRSPHELLSTVHPRPWPEIKAILLEQGFWEGELRHRTRDGREIIVSARNQLVRDSSGTAHVLEINRDITAHKRAEEALRQSEAKYRRLFDNIQELITVYQVERDDQGRIIERRLLDANPAFVRTASLSSVDQMRGKTSGEVFGESWSASHLDIVQRAMDSGKILTQEVHHSESGRDYITTVVPLDANTYLGTGRDITERKQAEEALRASENRVRAFFENAAVGTSEVDGSGRFVEVNQRLCQITGYSREELLRMTPAELTHPDDRALDRERLARFFQGDLPVYDVDKRYVCKDGGVIWVHVVAAMIRDAEGKPLHSASVIQDITERKQAEQALLRSEKLASVGRMAATIAHEINNPLETIGHALYLASTDPGSSAAGKIVSRAGRAGTGAHYPRYQTDIGFPPRSQGACLA